MMVQPVIPALSRRCRQKDQQVTGWTSLVCLKKKKERKKRKVLNFLSP